MNLKLSILCYCRYSKL